MDHYPRLLQATGVTPPARGRRWPSALRICCLVWSAQRTIL